MRPNFIMLIGLPGSGKSTYREQFDGYVQLSTDDLIEAEAYKQRTTYDKVWASYVDTATKIMNERLITALQRKTSVIFDRTNLTVKARRKVLSQVSKDYVKTAVYFEIDEVVRQSRMAGRVGKFIPAAADAQMRAWYVRPTFDEGFDYIIDGVAPQAVAA